MKSILGAAACFVVLAAGPAAPEAATPPVAGSAGSTVFAELEGLGFDLGKFHPDHAGRYPYRR